MKVHYDITQLPAFKNAVITIGTFDGLHNGHRKIIELMQAEAQTIGGETVIITFDPHPRQIVEQQKNPILLLNTLAEKIDLLQQQPIDHLVVVAFTEAFAHQTAEDYIADFLIKNFHPHTIVIGYDHRFGKNRLGDYQLMEDKAAQFDYVVKEIPAYLLEDVAVSSTKIREALLEGNIAAAKNYLSYDYFFSGTVIKGNQLGRTIGYPTANIELADDKKLVPANGVYAVHVSSEKLQLRQQGGMMNIGVRPTINGSSRVIEVNIFDFEQDIYGEVLTITLKQKLRSEEKFDGLPALKNQLAKDKLHAMAAITI